MSEKLLLILFSLLIMTKSDEKVNELISVNNGLALDLLNTFPNDGNNFFSPLSITTALLMVMNGAKGVTEQEFRRVFHLNKNVNIQKINEQMKYTLSSLKERENKNLILKLANLMLIKNGFTIDDNYHRVMSQMFDSTVDSFNFQNESLKIVNDWVSDKTNNKINDLFTEELPDDTQLLLVNAVYFKGIWKYIFDKKKTKKDRFYSYGKNEPNFVDMMTIRRRVKLKDLRDCDALAFEMPFADGSDMSMVIVLPNELNGLDYTTSKLTLKTLSDTVQAINKRKGSTFTLKFPKFKVETGYDLKDSLKRLGLKSMFEDSADLSAISGKRDLKVSKAIHKAFIEVAEEGAEAAAVTAVVAATRSYSPNYIAVDRPFIFSIIDQKSGLIWFLGQIRSL